MKNKNVIIVTLILIIGFLVVINTTNKNNDIKCGQAGINLKKFEDIQIGDSQFTVNSIIDSLDKWNDDKIYEKCVQEISKDSKDSVYNYTYKYVGENGGYALITFTADYSNGDSFVLPTVSKKEQINLK